MYKLKNSFFAIFLIIGFMLLALPAVAGGEVSLNKTGKKLIESLMAGKGEDVKPIIMTHKDLEALVNKKTDKKEYDKKVEDWIKNRIKEFKEAKGTLSYKNLKIVDVKIIPASETDKIKKPITMAVTVPIFLKDKKEIEGVLPVFFIQIGDQWKLSIVK